ncbi:MAG: septum formation initiator family protein [Candidatus Paceibacterota bacterium]|jgi:cell division protein FtsB
MKNFQKKRGLRNIFHSKPVLIFLGILVLIFAWGVLGFMERTRMTIENRKIAESKVAELEKEKEKLSSDIEKLKSQDGVEESIRSKFGLAKEGEGMIVIVEDKNKPEVAPNSSDGFFPFLFFWKNWFK